MSVRPYSFKSEEAKVVLEELKAMEARLLDSSPSSPLLSHSPASLCYSACGEEILHSLLLFFIARPAGPDSPVLEIIACFAPL